MSGEEIRSPSDQIINKGKHRMEGLLRGLDLNNVMVDKRSRNNSDSSQSNSGEASSKKKMSFSHTNTNQLRKLRKSSNENYSIKEVEEQEDSLEDNHNTEVEEISKEIKNRKSSEDQNFQRRKLRSSGNEKMEELSLSNKKQQKFDIKAAQHTQKLLGQQVQQEQSTLNLNNLNEEGLSSTSCSSDLLKNTRKKSSFEVESILPKQIGGNLSQQGIKQPTTDVDKSQKSQNNRNTINLNKDSLSFETNLKLSNEVQSQQSISSTKSIGKSSSLGSQGVLTRNKTKSDESIKQDTLEEKQEEQIPKKKKLKNQMVNISSNQMSMQSKRELRASKRDVIRDQKIQELDDQQKNLSVKMQSNQVEQISPQSPLDNQKSDGQKKIKTLSGSELLNLRTQKGKKNVSFKDKLSEVIGEDSGSQQIKSTTLCVYDYNVQGDSDSEKDYYPSKQAQKKHKKQKKIKKREENKLEIAIKKSQKLLQKKYQNIKQQRTIISVEFPSISSDEDEDVNQDQLQEGDQTSNKMMLFANKFKDLDNVKNYKQKRDKKIVDSNTSIEGKEGLQNGREEQTKEIPKRKSGRSNSNENQAVNSSWSSMNKNFESVNRNGKNIENVSSEIKGQINQTKNRKGNQDSRNNKQQQLIESNQASEENLKQNDKKKEREGNIENEKEFESQKKDNTTSTKQSKNYIEIQSKKKGKKPISSYPINLQNQMNQQTKQFIKKQQQNTQNQEMMMENDNLEQESNPQINNQLNTSSKKDFCSPPKGPYSSTSSPSSHATHGEDIQANRINLHPHSKTFDQTNSFSSSDESRTNQKELFLKNAQQTKQIEKSSDILEVEDDNEGKIQWQEGVKENILDGDLKEVEVDQAQSRNTSNHQRYSQSESRRRDSQNPLFYDPKIDFVNSNIFFKNFFTQFQPQDRRAHYQRVAYQHHLSHSQHGSSQQIQSSNSASTIQSKKNTQVENLSQTQNQENPTEGQQEIEKESPIQSLIIQSTSEAHINIEDAPHTQIKDNIEKIIDQQIHLRATEVQYSNQNEHSKQESEEMEIEQPQIQIIQNQQLKQEQMQVDQSLEQQDKNKEIKKKKIGIIPNRSQEHIENMLDLQKQLDVLYENYYPSQTYINCDLKYFNLELIIQNTGQFDIVYMDPPWRIKGGQQFDSQFMFSNSKFSLDYDTMSNKEIMDIPVEKLSKKGFLFLWILNTQMNTAIEMMQKWGYNLVDKIVWVKMKEKNVYLSHGYYFMHSFELCLIGYKNDNKSESSDLYPQPTYFSVVDEKNLEENKGRGGNRKTDDKIDYPQFFNKISNNVIFAEVRKKSQKPDEIYEIIDMMIPGAKKIELFARNNNLRPGWVSVGNQLGETYEKWTHQVVCDNCHQDIVKGKLKRYKSRRINNYDICENCVKNFDRNDFYEIQNKVNEDILHNYQCCNRCEAEPIWGIRFHCMVCKDYDLCEACVDENTKLKEGEQFHEFSHDMKIIEVPVFADGFPVHDRKCQSCFMSPIIGTCFTCKQCSGNFNLCQNCYFSKPIETIKNKRHKPEHQMDALISPIKNIKSKKNLYKCAGCGVLNLTDMYKCENCYGFYFCLGCYETKRDDFKTYMASSHKNYHQLFRYNLQEIEQQESENEKKVEQQNQPQIEQQQQENENKDIFLNVISQILQNDKSNNERQDNSLQQEEGEQNKEQPGENQTKIEEEVEENQKIIQEQQESNQKQEIRLNKYGKPKRPYHRKQKIEKTLSKEGDENQQDIKEEVQHDNEKNMDEREFEQNENKIEIDENQNKPDEKDKEEGIQSIPIVKKIRKKRVSKKQKSTEQEQNEENQEDNNQQQCEKSNQTEEMLNTDEQKKSEIVDEEKLAEVLENDDLIKEENENEETKFVSKKRKRRSKEEIERDREEKKKKEQEYLIGIQEGTIKKKRGRIPGYKEHKLAKVQDGTQLTAGEQVEQEQNLQMQQIENQKDLDSNNFERSQNQYLDKLSLFELQMQNFDTSPNKLVEQLQPNLLKMNQGSDENELLKSKSDESSLVEKVIALDSKENAIPSQSEYLLNQANQLSNNLNQQAKFQFQDQYINQYFLTSLLNSINNNTIQQKPSDNNQYLENNQDNIKEKGEEVEEEDDDEDDEDSSASSSQDS